MQPWEREMMNTEGDPQGTPSDGSSNSGNPGFFGSISNNLASGFESVVGGGRA